MASGGVISGVVSDASGRPVPQARVYFIDGPASLPDIAALTDSTGTFSLSAPVAGTYSIECQANGFIPDRAIVHLEGGGQLRHDFRLKQ